MRLNKNNNAVAVTLERPRPAAVDPAIVVRKPWQRSLLTFLMVAGPGLIVMEADNDADAVSTYMQAGGQYGLHLLWTLLVLLPVCYFVQEMVARLGIATGKGHAAMIYERFGKWLPRARYGGHPASRPLTTGVEPAIYAGTFNGNLQNVLYSNQLRSIAKP